MPLAVVFLPLVAAIIAGFFGRAIGDRGSQLVTCGALLISAALGIFVFRDILASSGPQIIPLFQWIAAGGVDVAWSIRLDTLSGVMILVVTIVSSMVHVYSIGYMAEDKSIPRFMAYLSLFTFFMLALVTANDFRAAVFRLGRRRPDVLPTGRLLVRPAGGQRRRDQGIPRQPGRRFRLLARHLRGFRDLRHARFRHRFRQGAEMVGTTMDFLGWRVDSLTLACILLFIGAMGKSAQIPLHTWLPDAMEGPTPVSALIHAATMVTAGVFMVARLSPLFEYAPTALAVVGVIGGTTCIFAASVAMVQNDIKKVVAYSTCSQLGYMFAAAGVSAYAAGIFHLFTHAFFKGLLFLCCGSVIHAMGGEQDMRRMGGLWRKTPWTYVTMWVGALSLSGIPPFSGYWSKDTILDADWASGTAVGHYAWCLGTLAAFMTAFYISRVMFMTFHGAPHADEETMHHAHESPWVMLIPLIVLAIGAAFFGWLGYGHFVGAGSVGFWKTAILVLPGHDALARAEDIPLVIAYLPLVCGIAGIAMAYLFYIVNPQLPLRLAQRYRELYLFLLNKWYFDELYDLLFVRPALALGDGLWKSGDGAVIDGLGPNGIAALTRDLARQASRLQTGYLYHYAFAMLIGLVAFVTWYLLPH